MRCPFACEEVSRRFYIPSIQKKEKSVVLVHQLDDPTVLCRGSAQVNRLSVVPRQPMNHHSHDRENNELRIQVRFFGWDVLKREDERARQDGFLARSRCW